MLKKIFISNYKQKKHFLPDISGKKEWIQLNHKSCSDYLAVNLSIENNKILNINYFGDGCIYMVGFAIYLADYLIAKDIAFAITIMKEIKESISNNQTSKLNAYFSCLKDLSFYPQRVVCLTLSVEAIIKWINKYEMKT